ncbi:hypothetical protein SDC9_120880 [bioreactor metagenome]|uniref:DUF871 domain-containing protein n=1 Tax=bioreactor metagenome TaxID=1076179 RepID=A0A645CAE3_9ZZZZ|nr:MupG family TIM beta-alpha barrel fold protein [Erysipelotrichaceae bacterium]
MKWSIAIYPTDEAVLCQADAYLREAKQSGFTEVFSSLHLTECNLDSQLDILQRLAVNVHQYQLKLSVDIGGAMIDRLLNDETKMEILREMHVDVLRLDYDFNLNQVNMLHQKSGINGFSINASTTNQQRLMELIEQTDPNIVWEACHNFYPRPQSGLTMAFLKQQRELFQVYQLPVTACVPAYHHPRLPLFCGLPTVEKHRKCGLQQACLELINEQVCDGIMLADPFAGSDELKTIRDLITNEPLIVRYHPAASATLQELNLLEGKTHYCRYDNSEYGLRLLTSRQMAEYGQLIPPRRTEQRHYGAITIDNIGYQRYSGEIQLIIKDAGYDENVNVAGYITDEDLWMLPYLAKGYHFRLIKGEN